MADIDIDPFGEHGKTDAQLDETGENIPLNPGGVMGGSTWQTEREQETSVQRRENSRKKAHQILCQQFVQGAI